MGLRRFFRTVNYAIQLKRLEGDVRWDLATASRNPQRDLGEVLSPSFKARRGVENAGRKLGLSDEQIAEDARAAETRGQRPKGETR